MPVVRTGIFTWLFQTAKHVLCRIYASFTPTLEPEDTSDWENELLLTTCLLGMSRSVADKLFMGRTDHKSKQSNDPRSHGRNFSNCVENT